MRVCVCVCVCVCFADSLDLSPVSPFLWALSQQEAEVKIQCAQRLPDVLKSSSASDRQTIFITNIMPYVGDLCSDTYVPNLSIPSLCPVYISERFVSLIFACSQCLLMFLSSPFFLSFLLYLFLSIFPRLCRSQHVRSAIASVLLVISPILGKDRTLEQIVPLFIKLLKDDVCISIMS
jgi:hypothetical protein